MEIIDNKSKILKDELVKDINKDSTLFVIAAYFSIYGFESLKEQLKNIKELDFIFSSSAFIDDNNLTSKQKENKIYAEKNLFSNEYEKKLNDSLNLKMISIECASWIKDKVKFKANKTDKNIQGIILNPLKNTIYSPIDSFSQSQLGTAESENLITSVNKIEDYENSKYYIKQFKQIFNDDKKVEDVTQKVLDCIYLAYKDNTPEFLYFFILFNIFKQFLEETNNGKLIDERVGFTDSKIFNMLYDFQKDGAIAVINKLEKYNGCILADSVGLGKTFTALAVIKYYSCKNKSTLVLSPKRLASNWNRYRDNDKRNILYEDHISYDVLYHTDLARSSGFSNGHDLKTFNWSNYDLLVIDESHNFRNANHIEGKQTRYDFLMNRIIKEGVKTKVLMLSATPVNNRFSDLKAQIALSYGDNVKEFDDKLDTTKSIEVILTQAQKVFNRWCKEDIKDRTESDLMSLLDIDFSILLDNISIARSRKHIQKYYSSSEMGKFPSRLNPKNYYCQVAEDKNTLSYKEIYSLLYKLNLSVYNPTTYIFDSRKEKYEKYNSKLSNNVELTQENREINLKHLMSINLMKRLESSIDSFRLTLNALKDKDERVLNQINEYRNNRSLLKQATPNIDIEIDDEDIENYKTEGSVMIDFNDMDILSWKNDIAKDYDLLINLIDLMKDIDTSKDLKLNKLVEIIDDKIENPINKGNKKIIIFTAFSDTANYIYKYISKHVKEKYNLNTAKIEGGNNNNLSTISGSKDTERLLSLFAPKAKDRDKIYPEDINKNIDILIATDCISEGQNLQDCDYCINYDIHWNPVRIVQRFGRIDRIGSENKYIQLVNFWPDISLDEYIRLNDRVANRMMILDATATGDDNIIDESKSDLEFRKNQLKSLQDGKIQDLEDVDGSISITDLGLNDFRMDLVQLYDKYKDEVNKTPFGIYSLVEKDNSNQIKPGVIFLLKKESEDINIQNKNRLYPYYLIYVSNKGEVIYTEKEVKKILDVLKKTCKGKDSLNTSLIDKFNQETTSGIDMSKYQSLLNKALQSLEDAKEKDEIDDIFKTGYNFFQADNKTDLDIQLVAYLIIK